MVAEHFVRSSNTYTDSLSCYRILVYALIYLQARSAASKQQSCGLFCDDNLDVATGIIKR